MSEQKKSLGKEIIGNFNPGVLTKVDKIKLLCADLIDTIDEERNKSSDAKTWSQNVLFTAAVNAVVAAQMALVKYVTFGK